MGLTKGLYPAPLKILDVTKTGLDKGIQISILISACLLEFNDIKKIRAEISENLTLQG